MWWVKPTKTAVYANRFRRRRVSAFLAVCDEILARQPTCRVLDLGGAADYWLGLESLWKDRPLHFTLLNLYPEKTPDSRFVATVGDGCALTDIPDFAFDVVHSNSVIEHVGSWGNKVRMAAEIRRVAPRYYVQTPNYWFPVEPHLRTPLIHWLPRPWQRSLVMTSAHGFFPRADTFEEADRILSDSSLLDGREMTALFPDARIERERFFGLVKSFVAIR
ncbi:hypothetical protein ASG40_08665 [Methylobacterium sp. Leaf399]|uniref:class I SAM-dependent methyltransferase n=1 Tax=Methylobacterium sp. Leaf399 TaxID=1736364 RepID=UPI0006FEC536|nr:class I SAM-dependent methyltransferase [Methylobacterium sp. Leaf399]KQT09810.1 hypothetical protein ASG40_08665 [Methylobacterium sp. Leaf399]